MYKFVYLFYEPNALMNLIEAQCVLSIIGNHLTFIDSACVCNICVASNTLSHPNYRFRRCLPRWFNG